MKKLENSRTEPQSSIARMNATGVTNREIAERVAREMRQLILCADCKTRGIPGTKKFNWPLCDLCVTEVGKARPLIEYALRAIEESQDRSIKRMVDRFLGWKLPENFNPDGGISFKKAINENRPSWPQKNEPTGTNLFDATQAEGMVRYMLAEESQGQQEPRNFDEEADLLYSRNKWHMLCNGLSLNPARSAVADVLKSFASEGGADTRELREALKKIENYDSSCECDDHTQPECCANVPVTDCFCAHCIAGKALLND